MGEVFRSDALHQIDTAGQAYIERIGVKRIIDFRSPEEIMKILIREFQLVS